MDFPKIHADCYTLCLKLFHLSQSFPKQYRPTLARRLEDAALDLTLAIKIACTTKTGRDGEKTGIVGTASTRLDEIRLLLQVSHDLELMPSSSFGILSELTGEIGKEIGGWKKSTSLKGMAATK